MQTCLNYGWASLDGDAINSDTALSPTEAVGNDRLALQLYERVAAGHVADKTVLEIGCGRGGGTEFLKRGLSAGDVVGVDITPSSIRWCQKHWSEPGLRFEVGDAEALTFADSCFDVVVNIESSHNYLHVDRFLRESHRVLRPGGLLLLADFRSTHWVPVLTSAISDAGFSIEETEDISDNVLRALDIMVAEWEPWIDEHVPRLLRRGARGFAATKNSTHYRELSSGARRYVRFVARKN
jgi:ubiquinone/menaquinone biosynthesis C-methylase UbiE